MPGRPSLQMTSFYLAPLARNFKTHPAFANALADTKGQIKTSLKKRSCYSSLLSKVNDETHNSGGSVYTKDHRPWKFVMYLVFADQAKAKEFEKYLKSQSGRAFAKKRFW